MKNSKTITNAMGTLLITLVLAFPFFVRAQEETHEGSIKGRIIDATTLQSLSELCPSAQSNEIG